jgi:AcrR family transcriptional regulator
MAKRVKPRRAYDSSHRKDQARATRRSVLDAARELFVDNGYAATSIDAVARKADVSSETIYAVFKNKRSLLSAVLDISIAGDDAPVPILDRDWVKQMQDEPDPRRRVQILARNGTEMLERRAPVDRVLQGAASADPAIVSLWTSAKEQRYKGQRALARIVGARGAFRPGLTVAEAADVLYAIGNPDTFSALVFDRGWSVRAFERWYADTLTRLLLA